MVPFLHSLLFQLKTRLLNERGQDLIEFALVAAMISLGAVAGMRTVASALSTSFSHLATTFNGNV